MYAESVPTKPDATANDPWAGRTATDRFGRQRPAVTQGVQETNGIVDVAQKKLGEWRDNARDSYQQVHATVHSAVCASGEFVRERPVKSILIAAGVGVIAAGGVLLGRYSMRRIRKQPLKSVLIAASVGLLIGHLCVRR